MNVDIIQMSRSFHCGWRTMICWSLNCIETPLKMPSLLWASTWPLKQVTYQHLMSQFYTIYHIHPDLVQPLTPVLLCLLGDSGNWIEIAYGTSSGTVRVIVQHPETVGSGPQLFQTFSVHRSPVTKIMLSEKHLISGRELSFLTCKHTCIVKCEDFNVIYRDKD